MQPATKTGIVTTVIGSVIIFFCDARNELADDIQRAGNTPDRER
jgi:hypothetical protein